MGYTIGFATDMQINKGKELKRERERALQYYFIKCHKRTVQANPFYAYSWTNSCPSLMSLSQWKTVTEQT